MPNSEKTKIWKKMMGAFSFPPDSEELVKKLTGGKKFSRLEVPTKY